MSEIIELTVGEADAGKRLDLFLSEQLEDISRSQAAKLIESGAVVPVCKSGTKLKNGQVYSVTLPQPQPCEAQPEDILLDILYEDADVIVVNKPKGMVVHPDNTHNSGTLVNALLYHCRDLSGIGGVMRPGIVHRIDMDTTGSVIACKNDKAHESLAAQLKEHSVNRRYQCICVGEIKEDTLTIDAPIGRSERDRKKMAINTRNGKRAVTHITVLKRFKGYTLLECQLETGRTHQIRVHLASIHHPILGDEVYGNQNENKKFKNLQGQCLHAKILGFIHPSTGEYIETQAPLPEYFENLLEKLNGMG